LRLSTVSIITWGSSSASVLSFSHKNKTFSVRPTMEQA
jgi:hypothetical protein